MSNEKPTLEYLGMSNAMISSALFWKIRHPGERNERVEFLLQEVCKNNADRKIVAICEQYMNEIEMKRLSANGGEWSWEHTATPNSLEYENADLICELVNCWVYYKGGNALFEVNCRHRSWE